MELITVKQGCLRNAEAVNQTTADYIGDHLYAVNTMDGYKADIKVFKGWVVRQGIETVGLQDIINFFIEMKETKKITTLSRYRVALAKTHTTFIKNGSFTLFFKALQNEKAAVPKHSKPLLADDFVNSLRNIKSDIYCFMLMLQYKGAFRISEILALRVKDVVVEDGGLKVKLIRTKTSKEGVTVGIQNNGSSIVDMFTRHVEDNKLGEDDKLFSVKRSAVGKYIKRNFGDDYSSHSLRSGHITSCILKNKDLPTTMKTSRHKSATTLINNYYTPANVFDNTSDII